jgi:thiamine-monophosphate kinase
LSDIAAMGGTPIAAFLSLALPANLPQAWADRFLKGFLKLASQFRVTLAGGDTSESREGVIADVVVLGSIPRGQAVLRSGARPGDGIYVTGSLGTSSATLALMFARPAKKLRPDRFPKHFFPAPRIKVGQILRAKKIATSMIDISDGLSTDLSHLCEESRVGAEIWKGAVPLGNMGQPARKAEIDFALHGGEEYELLFTARRGSRVPRTIAGINITQIGVVRRGHSAVLLSEDSAAQFRPHGWEHFRTARSS